MSDEVYDVVCRAQELLYALGSHVLSAREVVDQLDEVRCLLSDRANTVDDAMRVERDEDELTPVERAVLAGADERDRRREDAKRLDAALVENELLREAFTETQVIFEDARIDFVDVRVPRHEWLSIRSWRSADPAHGRAGSRWWRFSYEELRTLDELLDDWTAGRPGENKTQLALRVELQRELDARAYEAMKP